MLAEQSLLQSDPEQSLAQLQEQVRSDPGNAKLRIFLFQLLAILGQWERAMTQLKVAGELDAGALAMVQTYREALHCEVLRGSVFAGQRSPLVFGDPPAWIALLIEALRLTADGHYEQSQEIRAEAFETAPATPGTADGKRFEWIADADSRLGPVLEAVVNGRYYWIPMQRVSSIVIEQPADLRDLVWMPVYFTWANGGEAPGLIPTRYPGSEHSEDPQVRLAGKTLWSEQPADLYLGLGQRLYATDTDEYSLMDLRELRLDMLARGDRGSTETGSATTADG